MVINNKLHTYGLPTWICDASQVSKPFEYLLFDCQFGVALWSLLFHFPIKWNENEGFFKNEILVGYVYSFDTSLNKFWFVLANEVIWFFGRGGMKRSFRPRKGSLLSLNANSLFLLSRYKFFLLQRFQKRDSCCCWKRELNYCV